MKNKVILGSANFGLEYGVANKRKLSKEEALGILELASSEGIWGVDTARAYGNAEEVIGDFFERRGKVFNVISKLPGREYRNCSDVEREIEASLSSLRVSSVDFVLIHSYESYMRYGSVIMPVLRSFCKSGVVGHYGISVYHPEEAVNFMDEMKEQVAVEFPASLLDQRFLHDGFLAGAADSGNFLFARSVFLQGLMFLDDDELKGSFEKAENQVRSIRETAKLCDIAPECMAQLFIFTRPGIDGVVMGVDSREQLMRNTGCLSTEALDRYKLAEPFLSGMAVTDEDIILPYRWKT